jgi:hypothetical protein
VGSTYQRQREREGERTGLRGVNWAGAREHGLSGRIGPCRSRVGRSGEEKERWVGPAEEEKRGREKEMWLFFFINL